MKTIPTILLLIFLSGFCCIDTLFATLPAYGASAGDDPVVKEGKKSGTPVPGNIGQYFTQARHAYYQLGDLQRADSLSSLAVKQAEMTYRTEVILEALNQYLSMNELGFNRDQAKTFAKRAENLVYQVENHDLIWKTYINLTDVYTDAFQFDKALSLGYKSLATADLINSPEKKAMSYITIGKTLQASNQILEGFRYFLNALTIAESRRDRTLLLECYKSLSQFYNLTKGYEKAVSFKMKEIDLILEVTPIDSMALIWAWCSLEDISMNFNNYVHEEKLKAMVEFADRNNNTYLKQFILALYRSYLMKNDLFESLTDLYLNQYPEELSYLSHQQPMTYLRLMSIFSEHRGDIDSAHYHLRQASLLAENHPNKVMVSNFNIRYGEFLTRHGFITEALPMFHAAYELALQTNYLEFALKASTSLKDLYTRTGNYKEALYFAEQVKLIADSVVQMNRNDEMLALEIQNTAQILKMAKEEEMQKTVRRNNLQYSLILILILTSFVILLMLGSYKVSATLIHGLGFISFIFLFEFIILLADFKIHHLTHGEPLKMLGIKIILIAFLLPLHHWLEKRVIHYLVHKRIILFRSRSAKATIATIRNTMADIWGNRH
jgi:tetratricopeptide (TPR) repeat protein